MGFNFETAKEVRRLWLLHVGNENMRAEKGNISLENLEALEIKRLKGFPDQFLKTQASVDLFIYFSF